MHRNYTPSPLNIDHIELSNGLVVLVEKLAENAHDTWAENRISDGWVWGPNRCDEKRHHPCIIPYKALPEDEKHYDRAAVVSTLKAVLALGYTITNGT